MATAAPPEPGRVHGHEVLEVVEDPGTDEIRIAIRVGPGDGDGRSA